MITQVWYCKSKKKTGKPIHVRTIAKDSKLVFEDYYTNKFVRPTRNNELISVIFNNSKGIAKRQGATTILEIEKVENYDLLSRYGELRKGTKILNNGKKK